MGLTSIANRKTPSTPIEITFGAQPVTTAAKIATLFAHKASSGASASDYEVHMVTAFGDPDAAKAELDPLGGVDGEATLMARAFIKVNSTVSGRSNFPQFRIVFLPNAVTDFGPADEALIAVKLMRSDCLVSPYNATVSANLTKIKEFAALISGADRDMNGQFGSTAIVATDAASATALALNTDNQFVMHPYLQDTSVAPANPISSVAAATAGLLLQSAFPYLPLDSAEMGGLTRPVKDSDRIGVGAAELSELCLAAGLAPITWDTANRLRMVRTVVTRVTTDGSTPATAYTDWQDLVTLYDFREDCYYAVNSPNLKPAKASVQQAGKIKDEVLRIAYLYEGEQAFQNVKESAKLFVVEPSSTQRGRIDFRIPTDVIPGLHVVAGNIVGTVFTL